MRRNAYLLVLVATMCVAAGALASTAFFSSIHYLTPNAQLPEDCYILDVSPSFRVEDNRTIAVSENKDARIIPYGKCSSCFQQQISAYPRDSTYVIYGEDALAAAKFMKSIGFADLYVVQG